jgi:hypothetical protein
MKDAFKIFFTAVFHALFVKELIYKNGIDGFNAGLLRSENPYRRGTEKHRIWNEQYSIGAWQELEK